MINAGANMTVQLGTVIRCTGTITINGGIFVSGAAGSVGYLGNWPASSTYFAKDLALPAQNIAGSPAGSGAVTSTSVAASGGFRGFPHSSSARLRAALFANPSVGGGSGAGSVGGFGGAGGGPVVILCKQRISISAGGRIDVSGFNGGAGAGGGAGGTVLLASMGEISGAGQVDAPGGLGGNLSTTSGAGGGGGGGLVQMFAPVISFSGTTNLAGGTGGVGGGLVNGAIRSGGGGGGASGGEGGQGATVNADNNSPGNGGDGQAGVLYTATIDPTALLLMQ